MNGDGLSGRPLASLVGDYQSPLRCYDVVGLGLKECLNLTPLIKPVSLNSLLRRILF